MTHAGRIQTSVLTTLLMLATSLASTVHAEESGLNAVTDTALNAVINGKHRSDANRARDRYRRPKETLAFFGFRSDMTVVEVWPGGGWYTEILAPALADNGKLYAAHYPANPVNSDEGYWRRNLGRFLQKMAASPAVYDGVEVTTMHYPGSLHIAPNGSADLVVTFRNAHNWVESSYGGDAAAVASFRSMLDALKPGGVLGVVDHRWPDPATEDPEAQDGYVSEDRIIALATNAGFEFAGRSDINRNAKDTHKHPEGVWTLPPSLSGDDGDHDKYRAIGESDRMTLKFRKPLRSQ